MDGQAGLYSPLTPTLAVLRGVMSVTLQNDYLFHVGVHFFFFFKLTQLYQHIQGQRYTEKWGKGDECCSAVRAFEGETLQKQQKSVGCAAKRMAILSIYE